MGGVVGMLPRLLLCFLTLLALADMLCSGINKATKNATRTVMAPNKKGGPGIMEAWMNKILIDEWMNEAEDH